MESDQAILLLLSVSLLYLILFVSAQIYPKVSSEVRRKIKIRKKAKTDRAAERELAKKEAEQDRRAKEEEEEKRIAQEERRRRTAAEAVASEEAASRAAAEAVTTQFRQKLELERATEAEKVRRAQMALARYNGIWGDGSATMHWINISPPSLPRVVAWRRSRKDPDDFTISSVSIEGDILRWNQVYKPTNFQVSYSCRRSSRGLECELTNQWGSKTTRLFARDTSLGTLTNGWNYRGGEMINY